MLTRTLNTHPRIRCLDEVFINRFPNRNTGSYQEYIRTSLATRMKHMFLTRDSVGDYLSLLESKPAHLFSHEHERTRCERIGFKLMLTDVRRLPAVLDFAKGREIQLIHLVRKNSLAILISTVRNRLSGMPHLPVDAAESEAYESPRIELKTGKLITALEKIESSKKLWLEILESHPHTTAFYEDIIRDRETELEKLMNVLGVDDSVDLETPLRKIGPVALSDSVCNFDDVTRCLRGSAYEKYLHD